MARAAVGWYYRSCDGVIAPSHMAARQLQEMFNVKPVPIQVIPSGIPLPRHVSEEEIRKTRKELGLPSRTTPMLLYAGRIAREKNLEMLLDAFEQHVLPFVPETRLVLAGSGPDADVIQERIVASDALSGRVILTGFLPRPALDPIYAAADLFVFPSGSETQGMVVGEALAAGTPAVVVNQGGAPETVTDGKDGLRVPNNAEQFGRAVVTLLRDDARRHAMGEFGRVNADVRTPERMAEQVIDLYWNAVQAAERGGPRSLRTFREGQMRELIFYGNEQARESFRNSDRRIREQLTNTLRKRGRKIRVLIAKGLRPKGRR
jgi:glycosyltransferase involved in cell wall biosynthesis